MFNQAIFISSDYVDWKIIYFHNDQRQVLAFLKAVVIHYKPVLDVPHYEDVNGVYSLISEQWPYFYRLANNEGKCYQIKI